MGRGRQDFRGRHHEPAALRPDNNDRTGVSRLAIVTAADPGSVFRVLAQTFEKKNDCTQHGLESSKSLTDDSKGDEGVEGAGLTFSSSLTFGLLSGPKENLQRSL